MIYIKAFIKQTLPIYLLFIASALLSHSYFIVSGNYFNEACCDSVKQISFFYPFLDRLIESGSLFWSFNYGLGGDVFGQFLYYYTASPFFWVTALLFNIDGLTDIFELRLWISISKLTLAMIFFYHLLCYIKRSRTASILGSLVYGSSVYFTAYSLRYDFMVDGMIWLPLLLLGYERFHRDNKRGLFLLTIFIVISSNFYLAFINSIYLGLYVIFRYFSETAKPKFRGLVIHLARFFGQYAIGFLLAAFTFLPAVYHFLNVDRFYYEHQIPIFFSEAFYKALPYDLLFFGERLWLLVSFPAIIVAMFTAGLFLRHRQVRVTLIFVFVISLMALIPYSYSFFNGLSSIQYRWLYLLLFTVAYCTSFIIDHLHKQPVKKEYVLVPVTVLVLAVIVKTKKYTVGSFATDGDLLILFLAAAGSALLLLRSRIPSPVVAAGIMATILIQQTIVNDAMFTKLVGEPDQLKAAHERILSSSNYGIPSEQRLFDRLEQADTSFYRVVWNDQKEINAPLVYGYNGLSAYNSLLSGDIHRFVKKDYNTLQQNSPSLFQNVDNRMYIEQALGVKYHVASPDTLSPLHRYSLLIEDQESGLNVYRNDHALPIGFLYREAVSEDVFEQLSYGQRDELLLRAAVLEEGIHELPRFDTATLTSRSVDIPLQDQYMEHILVQDGKVVADPYNSIEFTNPIPDMDGELLVEIGITRPDGQKFIVDVNHSSFQYLGDQNIYNYPKEEIVFNLGNLASNDKIKVGFSPGEYEISHMTVHLQPFETFDRSTKLAQSSAFRETKVSGRHVSGRIDADEAGLLYLSIPYSPGWSATVDGESAEIIRVNHAFMGIPVSQGDHEVELAFTTPLFRTGLAISLVTLLILIIARFWKSKRTEKR
ncbi:YfhO family protein [Bhargavaea ginsengi]|uniref:YfhO family protein n=1 Tax=Bhargavaea ginsengi TaxID=426757 RepID=UPI00203F9F22|nr:YfhO family protein [Bhargavaea ginsengi]MCM3088099.1 YfhO family protein [Bhargavaea ginsengi]